MQAAEETGRKLKVYAVEKNPNAVITLHVSFWVIVLSLIYPTISCQCKIQSCCCLVLGLTNTWFYLFWGTETEFDQIGGVGKHGYCNF